MIQTRKKFGRNLAIRALRDALGMKQPGFAELLGVSLDTVTSWECGRNRIKPQMALRIQFATGADAVDLVSRRATLRDARGRPYTAASFRDWQASRGQSASELARNGAQYLDVLLEAAGDQRHVVYSLFAEWLEAMRVDLGLDASIKRVLRKRGWVETEPVLVGLVRQYLDISRKVHSGWHPHGFGGLILTDPKTD